MLIPVPCPCCGAEFFYPEDHPIHSRLQMSLDLDFREVQEIHGEIPPVSHPEIHEEVYDYNDDEGE